MNRANLVVGPYPGGPLIGLRAIAEAAGMDAREVADLVRAGRSEVVTARLTAR